MIPHVTDPATGAPIGPEIDPGPARRPMRGTVLEGRHVALVPLDPVAHLASLWRIAGGPEAARLFLYLFPTPPVDEAAFRRQLETMAAAEDPLAFAILDAATREALGHATLMRIEPAHRVIEVGNILYGLGLQRTPGGTEAQYLLARHVFEDLGYRRYEWKCNALNEPSRRAAKRYGFQYEGTFRDHMIVKSRSRDTAWFSMLASEWPSRRLAFERWLDPANRDPTGGQRLSLSELNATSLASDGLALRRAGPDDVAAFDTLQRAAYAWNRQMLGVEPIPLQTAPDTVLSRYETWLLDGHGRLAGALALEPHPDHLVIWSVSVDPDGQNAGTGRRLLAAAETRARVLGLDTIRLFTGAKLTKNIDWYGRRGYGIEHVEEQPDRQVVHMIKRIER